MTFFLTSLFMFLVFWRPQEWLFPFLYGLPILDGVVALAVLGLLIEDSAGTARVPRDNRCYLGPSASL